MTGATGEGERDSQAAVLSVVDDAVELGKVGSLAQQQVHQQTHGDRHYPLSCISLSFG